jgi:urease accessory protein UreE
LEGHLKIIFHMAVGESSDEMPRAEGAPESYAQYPLVILSQEEKKEVARVTADKGGNYRVALPPGNYVLDIQDRLAKHVHAAPRPFTVVSNQTVHVDMTIVSGLGGVGR